MSHRGIDITTARSSSDGVSIYIYYHNHTISSYTLMYYYGIGPHRIVQKAKPVYILYTSYIRNSLKFKECCMTVPRTVPKAQLLFSGYICNCVVVITSINYNIIM